MNIIGKNTRPGDCNMDVFDARSVCSVIKYGNVDGFNFTN